MITMTQNEKDIARELLAGTGVSLVDAARLVKNILDFKEKKSRQNNIAFCSKVAQLGISHLHIKQMKIKDGFDLYLKEKTHLRPDSFRDIKYLGSRLIKANAKLANMNFSELSIKDVTDWINSTFTTLSGFNKAHAFLSGLFNYAMRNEWLERNVVSLIAKKRIKEKQIKALPLKKTQSLLKEATKKDFAPCLASVSLLIYAGLRPRELTRLTWDDIDLEENIITINSCTSKTGGTRHIDICTPLKNILKNEIEKNNNTNYKNKKIVPQSWKKRWKLLRDTAGFKNKWVQDVLRHTYASYHAKHYKDLSRLQLNMGHTSLHLLRSRYINLKDISKLDAKKYFSYAC